MADHVHGANVDPRELALQIVDIVALRPEVELCYMGIANKCFEILENRRNSSVETWPPDQTQPGDQMHGATDDNAESEDDDEDDDDDEDAEAEDNLGMDVDEETESSSDADSDGDESESGWSDDSGGQWAGGKKGAPRLRLREILFYDDKVAVFKARHGRL